MSKKFEFKTAERFIRDSNAEYDRRERLPLTHPRHPRGWKVDEEAQLITLWWSGYRYEVELNRLHEPLDLLRIIAHVGEKEWRGGNVEQSGSLIRRIAKLKDWNLWNKQVVKPDDERAKLTPQLRYKILSRDGFRCRACGATPATGAFLQIDHIVPIAKGGRTVFDNLQTLCGTCNFGKGAT